MRTFLVTKEFVIQADIYVEAVSLAQARVLAEDIDSERATELEKTHECELTIIEDYVTGGEDI